MICRRATYFTDSEILHVAEIASQWRLKTYLKNHTGCTMLKNHFLWFILEHDCYENIKIKLWSGIILNHDTEIDCKV